MRAPVLIITGKLISYDIYKASFYYWFFSRHQLHQPALNMHTCTGI